MLLRGARSSCLPIERLALALLILAGVVLRFGGLGQESIWLDEATSVLIARMSVPSVVAWAAADIHPPVYYLFLHFWVGLGDSEFGVRALSAVFGVLAVIIVYVLGRRLFDVEVGMLSALLLALAPLHIWYSQEARMYVMAGTWSLLASCCLLLALGSEGKSSKWTPVELPRHRANWWAGYVVASALALYTHYYTLFVLLFQNLFVVYWLCSGKSGRRTWRNWLVAETVIAVLFLPWVPVMFRQVAGGGGAWVERAIGRPSVRALLDTWLQFSIGPEGRIYPSALRRLAYALFALCIGAAIGRVFASRCGLVRRFVLEGASGPEGESSYRTSLLFCLMYVSVPILTAWLVSQVKPMYTTRYLLPFLPPYCIIIAGGLRALKSRWVRAAIAICLVVILLMGNWRHWQIEQKDDWRGASAYVLARAQPGDVVLFSPRWNAKPFDYYARQRVELSLDLPVPTTEEAARAVISDLGQRYKRLWFFWQRQHYGDRSGIAKQLLDGRYQTILEQEFRGVDSLTLYDLGAR